MKLIPVKNEYFFEAGKHILRASVEHLNEERKISFCFDDRVVYSKSVPAGNYLTDDKCIHDCAEEYKATHNNVFSDLFQNHSDKVHLKQKVFEVIIDNELIRMDASMVITKGVSRITMSANNGNDKLEGTFQVASYSEALEKLRILVNTLDCISEDMTEHISEISDDKIVELISWKES